MKGTGNTGTWNKRHREIKTFSFLHVFPPSLVCSFSIYTLLFFVGPPCLYIFLYRTASSLLISVYTDHPHWNHPHWTLALNTRTLHCFTPPLQIQAHQPVKTKRHNNGGNGDNDEAPEAPSLFHCRSSSSEGGWGTIIVSLRSTLRIPSPQLGLREEERFRASYTSVHTIQIWHSIKTVR